MPQRNMTVARQTAKKIKLEKQFNPVLTKFFKRMYKDIADMYGKSERVGLTGTYKKQLIGILEGHYQQVTKAFLQDFKNYPDMLETKQNDLDNDDYAVAAAVMAMYITNHAPDQAQYILATSQKEVDTILRKILKDMTVSGEVITPAIVSRKLFKKLNDSIPGRVGLISQTETQNLSEKTKITSAEVAGGAIIAGGQVVVSSKAEKMWFAIMDAVTRQDHAAADGQIQKINIPYSVAGESLMYPGDGSLGASIRNIINCRCVSLTL